MDGYKTWLWAMEIEFSIAKRRILQLWREMLVALIILEWSTGAPLQVKPKLLTDVVTMSHSSKHGPPLWKHLLNLHKPISNGGDTDLYGKGARGFECEQGGCWSSLLFYYYFSSFLFVFFSSFSCNKHTSSPKLILKTSPTDKLRYGLGSVGEKCSS